MVGRVKGTNVIIDKTKTKTRAEGEQLTSSRRGRGDGGRQGQPLEPQVICLPSLALYEPLSDHSSSLYSVLASLSILISYLLLQLLLHENDRQQPTKGTGDRQDVTMVQSCYRLS